MTVDLGCPRKAKRVPEKIFGFGRHQALNDEQDDQGYQKCNQNIGQKIQDYEYSKNAKEHHPWQPHEFTGVLHHKRGSRHWQFLAL